MTHKEGGIPPFLHRILTDNSTSEHVTEPQQIRPSLERARAAGTPALVNVMIDTNVFSSGTRNQTMYK